jgi:formimidoylglutamate deiminase
MSNKTLFAKDALLPTGWRRNVLLRWDEAGRLTQVEPDAAARPEVPVCAGPLIPGMPNLHSHAFQRAFGGLTEFRGAAQDSFWSWRTLMYRFAAQISPEQVEAIATWLYIEMLEAGFTSVCEFHYLHHDVDGRPYADDAELALALLRAAARAGIGLTLLPVLYQASGFGGLPPNEGQRRFIRATDSMLRLLERLRPLCEAQGARLGLAPHSLRAVPPEGLREALAGLDAIDATAPVHIHIAEQTAEVDACLAWSGQRPVAWLLDHAEVDARWCLVHATHMDADEYRRAAASGAVAGLCPTTEANLGDGLFPLRAYLDAGGAWGIGSDSHISVSPVEELRWLEYGQRLVTRHRNIAVGADSSSVGETLLRGALASTQQATGQDAADDFVVLDADAAIFAGAQADDVIDRWIFSGNRPAVREVHVGGQRVITDGRHSERDAIARRYRQVVAGLLVD